MLSGAEIAKYIDHTNLKATATRADIETLCAEARQYGFRAVCVNPSQVVNAVEFLAGSEVRVATVIGFPLGATTSLTKAREAEEAVAAGAAELDMVINIGALKEGRLDLVRDDIKAVVRAARGALVKVILETCYLTDEEKVLACRAAAEAGANFVKTSTGFGPGGATLEDVRLLRANIPPTMEVKASGGIRDIEAARAFIAAGATRLGTSAGVAIVKG
ncbi:MAG: deoxyribose-phosphate aldolase [bacterium]|nr:deoxyribose-phosphate aldolase [Bacillota bacterium]